MLDILKKSGTRIKTGLALISGFLLMGYIDSLFVTWAVFGVLMFIGLNEAMKLFKLDDDKIYLYAFIMWFVAYFYPQPEDLVFIVAILFASKLAYTKKFNKSLFLPLMYPMTPFLFLLSLYVSHGIESLLWLVAIVAGTDIGAYFVGKSLGKTQFCETSPNKTLEGIAGGVVVAAILGVAFAPDNIGLMAGIFISLLVSVASIFGDLFESYLKREADMKDSGSILPGHGGILDRSDGYLFGGIVMLLLLRLFV